VNQPAPTLPEQPTPRPIGVAEAALLLMVWFYAPFFAQHGWEWIRSVSASIGLQLAAPNYGTPGSPAEQWWSGVFWIGLSVALLFYVSKLRRLPLSTIGVVRPTVAKDGPMTLMLALVSGGMFAVIVLVLLICAAIWPHWFGGEPGDSSLRLLVANFGHSRAPVSIVIYVILVAPIVEEIWFRGLLQPALRDAFGPTFGILATALVFAFAHTGAGPPVSQFIGGLVFGFAYERTRGLASPILLHMLGNGTYVAISWWGWSAHL